MPHGRTSTLVGLTCIGGHFRFRSPMHMTSPAATRACPRQPAPHVAPQLAPHKPAHSPPQALSGPACSAPATPLHSLARTAITLRTQFSICPAYPPSASHEPSPAREPVTRPMSTLAGLWTRPAPSSPPPCPACQHVRYVLGIQQLCSCCECVRSAQATAIHVRPATLDEPAAAQPRAQRLGCRQRILVLRRPGSQRTSHGQGSEHSKAVLMF